MLGRSRRQRRFSALLIAVLVAPASAIGADEPSVRFTSPRHRATVLGETDVRLVVSVPEGAVVDRLELRVDGGLLATLTEPPWETIWNAGGTGRAHRLEAILRLADGRRATAEIRTSPLKVDQIERVDLVNLYLVVRNAAGGYVTDLPEDAFTVVEDGTRQVIERFAATDKPLRVGLVIDSSRSMLKQDRLRKAKKAALSFLDILSPGDQGAVVHFDDYVHLPRGFSSDKTELAHAIEEAFAAGGTALYDAVWKTSRLLADFDGRRVMVLLSDGRDESSSGFEPGSLHTIDEALEQALRSEVMIFPIGLGKDLDREYIRRWDHLGGRSNLDTSTTLMDVLRRFADTTGGRAVISSSPGRLHKAFEEIANDLRHQYSIAYTSSNPARDGAWRSIEVMTRDPTLEVVTRKGYFAPKPAKSR